MNTAPVQIMPVNTANDFKNASRQFDVVDNAFSKDFETAVNNLNDEKYKTDQSKAHENIEADSYKEYSTHEKEKSRKSSDNYNDTKESAKIDDEDDNENTQNAENAQAEPVATILAKEADKNLDDKDSKYKKKAQRQKSLEKINLNITKDGTNKKGQIDSEKIDIEKDDKKIKKSIGIDIKSIINDKIETTKKSEAPKISLVTNLFENTNAGKDELGVNNKEKLKSSKSNSKLKINDQRKLSFLNTDKTDDNKNKTESLFQKAVDSLGKETEINPSDNNNRMQNRSVEIKHVQSAVGSQLRESVNNQIVKQAGIILKENGTGEIKLVMKPESLGKVRIHLSLNDNNIAGRIIVENNIVREIFESNLENLYKAFGSEGFQNGGLEVSVQGEGGNFGGKNRKNNGQGIENRNILALQNSIAEITDSEWSSNAVNVII